MKAAIIPSAFTTAKAKQKTFCLYSFSHFCPIQPPALAHFSFFFSFLFSSLLVSIAQFCDFLVYATGDEQVEFMRP